MADAEDRRVMKALLASGLDRDEVRAAMEKMAGDQGDVVEIGERGKVTPHKGRSIFENDDDGQ